MTTTPVRRAAWAAGAGLAGVGCYAARVPDGWQVAGAAVLVACAATSVGGLTGFLFGVPRRRTGNGSDELGEYEPNTNLEQISDWLTKILVGATLTQLGRIPAAATRLFRALEPAFGGQQDSGAVAGAVVVYFGTLGFTAGWLLTRLYLANAMSGADADATRILGEASRAERAGDVQRATALREQAIGVLGDAATAAREYVQLRQSLAPGAKRTAGMQELFDSTRTAAAAAPPDPEALRAAFQEGEGGRIVALAQMHGCPELVDVDMVSDALVHSRSAFEQYQALALVDQLVRADGAARWEPLVRVVERTNVHGGNDRQHLKDAILRAR